MVFSFACPFVTWILDISIIAPLPLCVSCVWVSLCISMCFFLLGDPYHHDNNNKPWVVVKERCTWLFFNRWLSVPMFGSDVLLIILILFCSSQNWYGQWETLIQGAEAQSTGTWLRVWRMAGSGPAWTSRYGESEASIGKALNCPG